MEEIARRLADAQKVPFLGELPIVQSIRESGDAGRPAVLQEDTIASNAFHEIIHNFVREVEAEALRPKPIKQVEPQG